MKIRTVRGIGILCLFIFSLPVWAYLSQDEQGIAYFPDSPPQGGGSMKMKVTETERMRDKADDTRKTTDRLAKEKRSNQDVKVVMYMTDWCGYCRKAREYLHSLGVDLTEYDIEKDQGKREEMRKLGGRGVPLIDVEGIIIKGYNPERIKDAVEKKKNKS